MAICFMIIVNTPGNAESFTPLLHAQWHGFTPTDLVFPSFLFAVGNALSFVMLKWNTRSGNAVVAKIFKKQYSALQARSRILLFALAIILTCWLAGWWMDKRKIYIKD